MSEHLKNQKLLTICVLFFILFNFPILGLVNKNLFIGGFPLLLIYILFIWILSIVVIATVVSRDYLKDNKTEVND